MAKLIAGLKNLSELKPCPFCGNEPDVFTCDRLISIGCKKCGYDRGFKGLLTTVPHKVEAGNGEYYNPNAYDEASEQWNKRFYE